MVENKMKMLSFYARGRTRAVMPVMQFLYTYKQTADDAHCAIYKNETTDIYIYIYKRSEYNVFPSLCNVLLYALRCCVQLQY